MHRWLPLAVLVITAVLVSACASSAPDASPTRPRPLRRPAISAATPWSFPIGGRHKPSLTGDGEFRVLVLFARFADDTAPTATWPDAAVLPAWARTLVDADADSIGTHPRNLSAYYHENSDGRFVVTGDVHYVTLAHPEAYYHTEIPGDDVAARGAIIREALGLLTDERGPHRVDLARYDTWSSPVDYQHAAVPDSVVDMIWFLMRTVDDTPRALPDARTPRQPWRRLTRASADFHLTGEPFVHRGIRVQGIAGAVHGSASGLMLFDNNAQKPPHIHDEQRSNGAPSVTGVLVHEFSHYHFGAGHFADGGMYLSPNRYGSFMTGMAVNSGNAYGHHHSYEKIRLGWLGEGAGLRIISEQERDVTVELHDQRTAGDDRLRALRIALPGTTQTLHLEPRGWLGDFESRWAPFNGRHATLRPGLLATHILTDDRALFMSKVRMLAADGRHAWRVDTTDPATVQYNVRDVLVRDSADALGGYDDRERIYAGGAGRWYLAGYWPRPAGEPPARGPVRHCTNCSDAATPANDNVGDRWDLFIAGDVITPWSNPPAAVWVRDHLEIPADPVGIHILSHDTARGVTLVRVVRGYEGMEDFPPARVTGLRAPHPPAEVPAANSSTSEATASEASPGRAGAPVLVWSASREPSMTGSRAAGASSATGASSSSLRTAGRYRILRSLDGERYEQVGETEHPATRFVDGDARVRDAERVWYRVVAIDAARREAVASEPFVWRR